MKNIKHLNGFELSALKIALDGYQRYEGKTSRQFQKICEALLGDFTGVDIWSLRDLIRDEDSRRNLPGPVQIIDPEFYKLLQTLTPQQLRVLRLIAGGYQLEGIARMLSISYRTAVNHKQTITARLKLGSQKELLKFAIDNLSFLNPSSENSASDSE